jgi:hypothetical protein
MEIIAILVAVLVIVIIFKIIFAILHIGFWALTLPFKILGALLGLIIFFVVLIPAGIVALLAGLVVVPIALIIPLLPVIAIAFGLWLLMRNNPSRDRNTV